MKVRVSRTSGPYSFNQEDKPCEEAYVSNLPKLTTEERPYATFQEFDAKHGAREGAWLSKGINHRKENGSIFREVPQVGKGWYVKLTSLKSLKDFSAKHGECVLFEIDGELMIEIYDTYRE